MPPQVIHAEVKIYLKEETAYKVDDNAELMEMMF